MFKSKCLNTRTCGCPGCVGTINMSRPEFCAYDFAERADCILASHELRMYLHFVGSIQICSITVKRNHFDACPAERQQAQCAPEYRCKYIIKHVFVAFAYVTRMLSGISAGIVCLIDDVLVPHIYDTENVLRQI